QGPAADQDSPRALRPRIAFLSSTDRCCCRASRPVLGTAPLSDRVLIGFKPPREPERQIGEVRERELAVIADHGFLRLPMHQNPAMDGQSRPASRSRVPESHGPTPDLMGWRTAGSVYVSDP